jgi:acetate kinase
MDKKYLIVNNGSASGKYAIYKEDGEKIISAHLEVDEKDYVCTFETPDSSEIVEVTKSDFENGLKYALNNFISRGAIKNKDEISAIAVRVVAPGLFFLQNKIIDSVYEKKMLEAKEKAPLHISLTIHEVAHLKKEFNKIPIVGISDSAFHESMLKSVERYAISKEITEKYEVQRYGYHGISVKSILFRLAGMLGPLPRRIIICHLGGGASVTAIKDCRSFETSMGFTPLEGAVMATRAGDIDPGAISYLSEKLGIRGEKLRNFLNYECGLLGVSGKSSSVKDLFKLESEGDKDAKLALDIYVHRIKKYIGAYYTILGGADMIVFSATVGERSYQMRARICEGLGILGINIDKDKNERVEGKNADISNTGSKVKIMVIKTDEMSQMARDVGPVLTGKSQALGCGIFSK